MNFLGHAYFSFDSPDLMVGNYLGDFVKGNAYADFPDAIANGILLHRFIDHESDRDENSRAVKKMFVDGFGHYSAVLVDIYFDHLLAIHWDQFHAQSLAEFTDRFYHQLSLHTHLFTPGAAYAFPYMRKQNWLYNYQFKDGIIRSLEGISHRTKFTINLENSYETFSMNQRPIEEYFYNFMGNIEKSVEQYNREL